MNSARRLVVLALRLVSRLDVVWLEIDHAEFLRLELTALSSAIKRSAEYRSLVRVDILGDLGISNSIFDSGLNKRNTGVAAKEDEGLDIGLV